MTDPTTYRTNRDLFSNHYLDDHLRETEPWNEVPESEVEAAFEEINELWQEKQDRVEDYNEAQLEKNFIHPIFEILGIPFEIEETVMRNARRPDYGFFPSEEATDAAFDREDFYEEAIAVADAKRWGRKLDTRGEEKRDFENPSYQIHRYLQETPTEWAVLTNGERWRLYYGPTSHRLDSYYEIHLPTLLDAVAEDGDFEAFKEFYLFFRQEAFLADQSGDCFLDDVYDESSVFAEDLGEELQENIYEAIRVLAEGFLDTNEDLSEDNLERIHDSSLIYLYRLIFVLYAESEGRDLLPTDNDIYSGSYSLNELKQTVVDNRNQTQQHYQTWQTNLWDRLEELFVLIDQGSKGQDIPKEDLYIPAYNGGLFRTNPDEDDSVESQFLSEYEVGDAYIAEVIELLTRHEASEGEGKVFVDYSSLDERNLGSIYEGLLEYKLAVADEALTVDDGEYVPAEEGDEVTVGEGDVYLQTDDGERKATGSYYTPEYVVEYIVDETLGPLVEDIREDLVSASADTTHQREGGFAEEFADRIFDLTVLDPAMGSGHFPVNAVDYLAREIIDAQEQQDRQAIETEGEEVRSPRTEEGELRDINWARRKVAQRCIFGVDVNPLATELAKVSLWLRTLAAEQPLAFLDHHLKTGNSLVGSDIEDVLADEDNDTEDGQLTLQQSFDHTRQQAMEHVTERFQELLAIDNETLEDIKEMEEVYEDVREDPLYQKLLAMANVHTAGEFGLDVPEDADKRMAEALRSESWEEIEEQDWYKSAQALAEEERVFHWELEFPTAFYDEDGERKEDAGFDAVIGNPPYVTFRDTPERMRDYYREEFSTFKMKGDIYVLFMEATSDLTKKSGWSGFIIQNKFMRAAYGEHLREEISGNETIEQIIDLHDSPVFDVTTYPAIIIRQNSSPSSSHNVRWTDIKKGTKEETEVALENGGVSRMISQQQLGKGFWHSFAGGDAFNAPTNELKNFCGQIGKGAVSGNTSVYIVSDEEIEEHNLEEEYILSVLRGGDVTRYQISDEDTLSNLIYPYKTDGREPEVVEESEIPNICDYLSEYRDDLEERKNYGERLVDQGYEWYELTYNAPGMLGEKIVFPDISPENRFAHDEKGTFACLDTVYYMVRSTQESGYHSKFLTAILNSNLLNHMFENISPKVRGGYKRYKTQYVEGLPIPTPRSAHRKTGTEGIDQLKEKIDYLDLKTKFENSSNSHDRLVVLSRRIGNLLKRKNNLNLNLLDYLGNYEEGPNLPDIGLYQPTSENVLDKTADDYDKLQIEQARTTRNGRSVTIEVTARYKPENEDEYETDTYGYTETDFYEAFTRADLDEKEAALVEAFVPVAVEEEIGGFSDNATKTISLMDRLKGIILPDPDDVADDLERYIETKERAEELAEKIEKTDQLIDEIVYDLYDLTEEEIEIVEEAVADD